MGRIGADFLLVFVSKERYLREMDLVRSSSRGLSCLVSKG